MLFLLLRLLTAPTTLFPAAVVVDTTTRPHAAVVDTATRARGGVDAALRDARAQQETIDAGPGKIRTLLRGANDTQYHASCVAQRLAEAQVHVSLARDEMQRLTDPSGVSPGDREHALRRLTIIAERTREVEGAARLCLDDELSSIERDQVRHLGTVGRTGTRRRHPSAATDLSLHGPLSRRARALRAWPRHMRLLASERPLFALAFPGSIFSASS